MSQQFFVKGNASRLIRKQVSGTGITAIDETGKKIKTSPEVNMHFAIKKDFFVRFIQSPPPSKVPIKRFLAKRFKRPTS